MSKKPSSSKPASTSKPTNTATQNKIPRLSTRVIIGDSAPKKK